MIAWNYWLLLLYPNQNPQFKSAIIDLYLLFATLIFLRNKCTVYKSNILFKKKIIMTSEKMYEIHNLHFFYFIQVSSFTCYFWTSVAPRYCIGFILRAGFDPDLVNFKKAKSIDFNFLPKALAPGHEHLCLLQTSSTFIKIHQSINQVIAAFKTRDPPKVLAFII